MLTRRQFPLLITILTLLIASLAGRAARADENVLYGPHPFLKDNELSAHFLIAAGLGDSWGGTKVALDYGYRISGPVWLNLQLNVQKSTCALTSGACTQDGSVFETLAGGKWKFTTDSPLVPDIKVAAGLVYLFPAEARSAVGLALRTGAGVHYFFFDWLGFGLEANLSLGHGFFDSSYGASHSYVVLDAGGGIEFQF
jgi:hypothetical protein